MKITVGNMVMRAYSVEDATERERDTRDLYEVRNHPSVRTFLKNPSPIPFESHCRWVADNLASPPRVRLFIVRIDDIPVGIALLKNVREGAAEVGMMVKDAQQHPGVGFKCMSALIYAAHEHLHLSRIYADVSPRNLRAVECLKDLGFLPAPGGSALEDRYEFAGTGSPEARHYRRVVTRLLRVMRIEN